MLAAKNVQKKYGQLQVLKGVDIDIAEGEIVSIVGSSGAGKSTLLHILGTLDSADKGEILLKNQRVDNRMLLFSHEFMIPAEIGDEIAHLLKSMG